MPAILGCDGAGIVQAIGEQVQRFRVGDPVYFCYGGIGQAQGNYAERVLVDERFVAAKPQSLSFAEAAAVPLVLITAWESLYERGQLTAGQRVLIHGGAGGVGHLAIQLAKLRQAQVLTTVSNERQANFACQLGADAICFYQRTDFAQAALDWAGGQGVDLVFDTVGGPTLSRSFAATGYGGNVVTLLEPAPDTDWKTARSLNLRVGFELMLTPMLKDLTAALQHQAEILAQAAQLFDQGKLRVHIQQTLPLAAAAEAHQLLEAGGMIGKIVLLI